MRLILTCLAFVAVSIFSTLAHGHFVWLKVSGQGPQAQVEVYFAETADPGEPHLVEKIAGTTVWVHSVDNADAKAISLKPVNDEVAGKLAGRAPDGESYCLDAICDYGVVDKGGQPFLLQYYARHIQGDARKSRSSHSNAPRAPLEVQLDSTADGLTCTVLWNGKPLPGSEVVVHFPEGDALERTTNDRGLVQIATKTKGEFAIRARHVEPGKSGERDGKKYAEVRHYATLTASIPSASSSADAERTSAAELLRAAREARAVWQDFPGFSADLTVRYNDETAVGKIIISGDGDVILKTPKFAGSEWLQTYMESVVQHRMPGDPDNENVRYVDDQGNHPLGRKIALGDGDQDSVYRIDDDIVREVNRQTGRGRFTISVLEVERNREGKYLPVYYTMTFWDTAGKVVSTNTTQDSWVRVGGFDLPLRTLQVTTAADRHEVKLLEFSNHALSAR